MGPSLYPLKNFMLDYWNNSCKDGDFKIDDCPLRNSHFLNQKILKFKIENLTDEKFETKILSFEKFTKKTIQKILDLLYGISFEDEVKYFSDSEMTLE